MWRRTSKGALKVLLVHRPDYDDWTLPKGKLEPGETAKVAALREVEEETGLVCELEVELPSVRYVDRKGRAKRVRYWAMQPLGGSFEPNSEVDEVRWMHIADAIVALSYEHDEVVVEALRDLHVAVA